MKRKILGVLILLSFFLGLSLAFTPITSQAAGPRPGYSLVGSTTAKKFHKFNCKWAAKITPKNACYFKTRGEAMKAGYKPCSQCKP